MIDPVPQIPPSSSGSCVFVKTSYTVRGSVGVLSYESNAFTLAIMFSNPFDRFLYSSEFAIQLFAGRKQFYSMEHLFHYMFSDGPPYKCKSYRKVKLEVQDGQLEVTNEEMQCKGTTQVCGHTFSPVPPSIGPQSKETCVFVKRNFSTWGIAGIFTYESDRFSFIATFSNPFNNNLNELE
ncbi:hypothetical protein UY3_00216 [Chelonia mydas]|uniref:Uncharacterized protein n=1 Tax=Chelonia mydas TaxID=8469 RepID=M7C2V4_CHEMY|nr:hypothetical protein UY3_00216 [Chelonia mydas]